MEADVHGLLLNDGSSALAGVGAVLISSVGFAGTSVRFSDYWGSVLTHGN
jgi:hypothetical protein